MTRGDGDLLGHAFEIANPGLNPNVLFIFVVPNSIQWRGEGSSFPRTWAIKEKEKAVPGTATNFLL